VIAPYERTLNRLSVSERVAWGTRAQIRLVELLPPVATVLVLAGRRYREHIVPFLERRGHAVEVPMEGLGFGKQLQWLGQYK
jgi:uncharacterized membrane protein YfbV (UPF0208 family)